MTTKKLSMCRICLVENVRMYVVVNRHLQEMYEKLTNIPLVTQDSRPMLVCYFCITKLKQCCRLQRKCLLAEKMFAWMLNEGYQRKPRVNQGQLKFSSYVISPTEHMNIFDECQTESDVIKTELPDDYERQDNIVESKEEHQTDPKHEFKDIEYVEIDIAPHSELDADNDVPLFEFKTEEEQSVSKKKRKAHKDMKKSEHEFQDIQNVFKPSRYSESEDVPPQYSESDSKDDFLLINLKTEVEEEQEISKTKQNADDTKWATVAKKPKIDIRRSNLGDTSAVLILPTEYNVCNIGDINRHRRLLYIEEKPYKCEICQKSFNQKGHLTVHMRVHTKEKPYKCEICQRSFAAKSSLTQHIRTHTSEKPYKCEICQKSFNQTSHLTVHMRVHTKEKPYKCEICQRSFTVKSNLTLHIRTHTREKPYKCEICQRSFAYRATLIRHIRVHNLKRSKSFKCHLCKRSFAQNNNLKTHMRVHTRYNLTNVNNGKDALPE